MGCIDCGKVPLHAKGRCKACYNNNSFKNIPKFFLMNLYNSIEKRCTNPTELDIKYKGLYLCSKKDFLRKFRYSKKFLRLFKEWQDSGWNHNLTPSVDRIDSRKGYHLDNIQMITTNENKSKDRHSIKWVKAYTKKGEYIGRFKNRHIAAWYLGIPQLKIWQVLDGQIKQTYGYKFEWWIPPDTYLAKRMERDKKRAIRKAKLADPGTQG